MNKNDLKTENKPMQSTKFDNCGGGGGDGSRSPLAKSPKHETSRRLASRWYTLICSLHHQVDSDHRHRRFLLALDGATMIMMARSGRATINPVDRPHTAITHSTKTELGLV